MTTPPSLDLAVPSRALAIGAHPDDVEFGCGGTLAKWAAAGCVVHHLVCTDGSKGSWDPDEDTAALVQVREREQRAAAAALGATGEVVFMGWTDGELEDGLAPRARVAAWIRRLRPDVVLGHDPWKRYRLHPDHQAAGFLTVHGIVVARDPHFPTDPGAPVHRPSTLLLWEADEPDHVEDVTATIDTKVAALLEHRSQYRSTMSIETTGFGTTDNDGRSPAEQVDAFRDRVHSRARAAGGEAGVPYGERFKAVRDL